MMPRDLSGMFRFEYEKPAEQIVAKMKTKVAALKAKIEERRVRVTKIRDEYGISDAVYIGLLEEARQAMQQKDNRMSYTISNVPARGGLQESETITIGAGVVNNLLTETDYIKAELAEVKRLELISRNLEDKKPSDPNDRIEGHTLSESELQYLDF